jgi:hypothetical protein
MVNDDTKIIKKIVLESLTKTFNIKSNNAKRLIEDSTFAEMLIEDPEFVGHYSAEYWAYQILEESKFVNR